MHTEMCGDCGHKETIKDSERMVAIIVLKLKFITYAEIKRFVFRFTFCLVFALLVPADHAFCGNTSPSLKAAPQVLVIHSYYSTFTWSDEITQGIRKAFAEDGQSEELIYFEFLDAKRHPQEEYLDRIAGLLRIKYPDPKAIDVIICSDDQALNFLLDCKDTLFPGVPVVFCAVNGYNPQMKRLGRPLTGVIEAIDPKSTLETALRLQPHIREVMVINDITRTGQAIENMARQMFKPFQEQLLFRYVGDMSIAELQAEVAALSKDAIVFLFVFNRDNKDVNFTHEASLKYIADHCKVPIYGPWTFYLGKGIVGGMLTCGEMQGKTAARLALRILKGERAEDIPVVMKSPNRYMFDYQQLTLHNLPLDKLPPGSEIINRPASFYQKYQYRIWAGTIALIVQAGIIILLLINIGRRKHAEKGLISSEDKYRSLVETMTDGVFTLDTNGRFTFLNPEFENVTGYSDQDFIGRPFTEILAPEYIESTVDRFKRGVSGETIPVYEVELKHKDGGTVPVELKVTSLFDEHGKTIGRIGVARDVSERKKAEDALRESEKKFRIQSQIANIFLTKTDEEMYGEVLDVVLNLMKSKFGVFGYIDEKGTLVCPSMTRDIWEQCQITDKDIIFPEDTWGDSIWGNALRTKQSAYSNKSFKVPEGHVPMDRCLTVPLVFQDKSIGLLTVANKETDYTESDKYTLESIAQYVAPVLHEKMERKQTEKALREGEEKYRSILENIEEGYSEVDLAGNFTFFNDSIVNILGYSEDELMGLNSRQYTDKENAKKLYETFNRVYKTGEPAKAFGWEIIRKDGTKRYVEASVSLMRDAENQPIGFRGITRDLTEKMLAEEENKKLQAQLSQAQKMEAIGTLSGGIAHDFNNLLMGIQGRTSLMLMDKDLSHPDFEHLKGIEVYVKSAAGLTKQLLGFARGGKYEVKPTDINELITKSSDMFARTKKEIKIHGKYQKNLWTVETDHGQIEQVLMNLYVNAWQAMPGGGELYLQTKNVTLDENYVKPFEIKLGRYVKISVTDTGVGMDEDTRERIFDPFFTTKEMGRGTGLGLASAYGIIKNHGGFINVYSEKGEGATFNIYLPASESEVGGQKSEVSEDVRSRR